MSRSTIRPVLPLPVTSAACRRRAPARCAARAVKCASPCRLQRTGTARRSAECVGRRSRSWSSAVYSLRTGLARRGDQIADDGADGDLLAVFGAVGRDAQNAALQAFDFLGCLVALEVEERLAGFDRLAVGS